MSKANQEIEEFDTIKHGRGLAGLFSKTSVVEEKKKGEITENIEGDRKRRSSEEGIIEKKPLISSEIGLKAVVPNLFRSEIMSVHKETSAATQENPRFYSGMAELSIAPVNSMNIHEEIPVKLNEIAFSSEQLSAADINSKPLLIDSSDSQLSPENLSLIPSILQSANLSALQITKSSLLSAANNSPSLSIMIKNAVSCICGQFADIFLPCKHPLCFKCIKNTANCPICQHPFSAYSLPSKHYQCLSCRLVKRNKLHCPHYCVFCIKRKLKTKSQYACNVCGFVFQPQQVNFFTINCVGCGKTCIDYYEPCENCSYCENCFLEVRKTRKCEKCEKKVMSRALAKCVKMDQFRCHVCMELQRIEEMVVQPCCDVRVCQECSVKLTPECLCRGFSASIEPIPKAFP
jgi:hypothetical protein